MQLRISEEVDLLCLQTHTGAVEQTQEIFDVVIQLQHTLHKLTNAHLIGLLEAIEI